MARKKNEPMQTHREAVLKMAGPQFRGAVDKLASQMESENESVSQRAAKELIDLFADAVMKEEEREIVVRIEGMPELGMPDGPEGADG